ncbi:MAG: OmpH family outer membrane protein [bacterium]
MKLTILSVAVFGFVLAFSTNSFAQKIGVVDGTKVLSGFSEFTAAQAKIQGIYKLWQDTALTMQKNLKEKFDNYSKIKETMSKEALAKADEELQKLNTEITKYNDAKTNQQTGEIVKLQNDLITPVREKATAAVGTVAKKRKLDLIFEKSQTSYYAEGTIVDITDDVIAALKK